MILQEFDLKGAIILQILLSLYYIYFIIRPLSEIEKISGKLNYGYRLFIMRFIILIGIDIFDPTFACLFDTTFLLVLSFIIMPQIKKEKMYIHTIDNQLAKYDELSESELSEFGIKNRKLIEQELFKKIAKIQTARSKYDYDTLKKLCTEKQYNLFISELEVLHQANLGYNFEDYKYLESQIYEIKSDDKKTTLKIALKVSCISYRLDAEKNLVDGSKTERTIIISELEFEKKHKTNEIEKNCPNCGAPTKRSVKGKCSYCNTIIETESSDWLLSKNKVLAEKIYKS